MKFIALSAATLALTASALAAALAEPADPAQAIAQRFSEASDPKPASIPARPSLDYEMDMLRRARAEELERQKQDAQKVLTKVAEPAPFVAQAPVAPAAPPTPAAKPQHAPAAKVVETAVSPTPGPPPARQGCPS
jgi:hypothetical protein